MKDELYSEYIFIDLRRLRAQAQADEYSAAQSW